MTRKNALPQIVFSMALLFLISSATVFGQTTFGTSEDGKALGYPDGRKIVRDASGNLYAAFRKKYNSYYQIFVAKSSNGGSTWNVPSTPISTVSGSFNQRVPSIAIDGSNTLHVTWYGQDSGNSGTNQRQIKYSKSTDLGLTWSAWRNIAPVSGYNGSDLWQEHPVVYVDGNNIMYVVWEGHDSSHSSPQAKFIKSTDGGNFWTSWINVAALSTNQSRPTIVVDSAGKIFVVAYGYWSSTGEQNILFSTSTNGGASFSGWSAVSPAGLDQRHPSAAIDSGNKIHLVWREANASAKTDVRYLKYTSPAWAAKKPLVALRFITSFQRSSVSSRVFKRSTSDPALLTSMSSPPIWSSTSRTIRTTSLFLVTSACTAIAVVVTVPVVSPPATAAAPWPLLEIAATAASAPARFFR
ncbi:MAG: exo-alpha-sialidase [Acidobacteria bacterium]|nr:exo-alpha-sialidase [Acidobacteriota bacterium]